MTFPPLRRLGACILGEPSVLLGEQLAVRSRRGDLRFVGQGEHSFARIPWTAARWGRGRLASSAIAAPSLYDRATAEPMTAIATDGATATMPPMVLATAPPRTKGPRRLKTVAIKIAWSGDAARVRHQGSNGVGCIVQPVASSRTRAPSAPRSRAPDPSSNHSGTARSGKHGSW